LVVIWRDQSTGYATLSTALHTQELSLTLTKFGGNTVLGLSSVSFFGSVVKFHLPISINLVHASPPYHLVIPPKNQSAQK